jgi:hypothetical protein
MDSVLAVVWKNRTVDPSSGAEQVTAAKVPKQDVEGGLQSPCEEPMPNACDPGASGGEDVVVVIDMDSRAPVAVSTVLVTTGGTVTPVHAPAAQGAVGVEQ